MWGSRNIRDVRPRELRESRSPHGAAEHASRISHWELPGQELIPSLSPRSLGAESNFWGGFTPPCLTFDWRRCFYFRRGLLDLSGDWDLEIIEPSTFMES
ncbi:hypothetical protein J6590_034117 [Homalodisca vitripennis]|nr:hypothetical protein J6590_034117 [Homalodisca vitripennis]